MKLIYLYSWIKQVKLYIIYAQLVYLNRSILDLNLTSFLYKLFIVRCNS